MTHMPAVPSDPTPAAVDAQQMAQAPYVPASQVPQAMGPFIPTTPLMEKKTYSSPLSYIGATRRASAWARRVGSHGVPQGVLSAVAAITWLMFMYLFVTCWYIVVFGIFGLVTFPYRFIRRGQRKSQHIEAQQLATMQAILIQQQSRQ